jgi:transcriptional regulator with XRE-family HTH domain
MKYISNHVIKNLRKQRGFSQERLAQLSGATKNYIGQIERGEFHNVSIEKLTKISKALGVHITDLLPRKEEGEAA